MRRVLLTFSFFLTTVSNLILAQDSNWSLGLQVGRSQLIGFTGLSFEQNFDFEAQGMGGVILQLYGKYFITEKVSIQAGGGINNLVSGMRFYNRRSNNLGTRGVTQQYFMGLDYDIPFGKSDFGLLPRISFAMTGSNARSKNGDVYNFGPKEFSLGGVGILHIPTGEYEDRNIYLRELQIRASNYKFIYHIRPEISIYKNFWTSPDLDFCCLGLCAG